MPYNLRRPPRVPLPKRGDRVTIFWTDLHRSYTGTLTTYDSVHATFLVVYDSVPRGFDDNRIWEALNDVPWTFGEREGAWFRPGELAHVHPRFEKDKSRGDSEDELLDRANECGSDDADEPEEGRDDHGSSWSLEEGGSAEMHHTHGNDEARQPGKVPTPQLETSTAWRVPHTPENDQHGDRARLCPIQVSQSESENSLNDTLYHPPGAPTRQPQRRDDPQPAEQSHPQTERHLRDMSESGSEDILYRPPLAVNRQAIREQLKSQEQQVGRGSKRQIGNTLVSESDSGNSLKDILYHPPLAVDWNAKRQRSSEPVQQRHTEADRPDEHREAAQGKTSQSEQHGPYRTTSPVRASQIEAKDTLREDLYDSPLGAEQQSSKLNSDQQGDQKQAGLVRASNRDHEDSSMYSSCNQPLVSPRQILRPTLREPGQHGLYSRNEQKDGHVARAPNCEPGNIFDDSLYEPPLAPKRKEIRRTAPQPVHQNRSLAEGEAHHEELQASFVRESQPESEDLLLGTLYDAPLTSDQAAERRKSSQSRDHLHSSPPRESKHNSGYTLYHQTQPSHQESVRGKDPAQRSFRQAGNFQTSSDPGTNRRYANFGSLGLQLHNRVGHANPTQKVNPAQFYPQDTVHVNILRELQPHREKRPSHHTNHDSFRVSTGHHVLHSDLPSVEDHIKCITKTLGVMDDVESDQGRKEEG